jgi:putative transposase
VEDDGSHRLHFVNTEPYWEPGRKKPARGVHIRLGEPNVVWTTLCTADRMPWLANEFVHVRLQEVWLAATKWLVSDYILMPDHIHFFAAPYDIEYPFDKWMTYWERQFGKMHDHDEWRWQPHPFHRRLRDGESYAEKWQYMQENPERKGLVQRPDEWPFQGRIHDVRW